MQLAGRFRQPLLMKMIRKKKAEMIRQSNAYLNRALEVYPLYINPNLLLANNYYYLGDYDKAIAQYETLLQLDPDNENGLQNMAVVYRDAGTILR